ncbi:MAG TPA: hypothetical protein VM487_10080 [Phycisphaerae bacterium]|nr:hypothetical protein [Phycisphaerae bacterium]
MDFADHYWLILLGAFLIMELPAALWRPRWTFSAHIWKWFAIGQNWMVRWAAFRWFILAGLLVATTAHFLFETSAVPIIVFAVGMAWSIWFHYARE